MFIPTYISANLRSYLYSYICLPAFIPTYISAYLHSYLLIYLPNCVHTYTYICLRSCLSVYLPATHCASLSTSPGSGSEGLGSQNKTTNHKRCALQTSLALQDKFTASCFLRCHRTAYIRCLFAWLPPLPGFTYLPTCLPAYVPACLPAYLPVSLPAYTA